ncbi:MAG: serine hydrolase [Gammaproteobacteria bacterium]|nr:serine hydrolase [Gammaproteobacteria bacterium]MDG2337469.1 serine hydrolase [Gammaproteobacteria bacterium]
MRSISKIQLTLVAVATTLLALASTFASAELEKYRLDAIASDLQARVDESMLSGVVALIAQDGEIQMNQAFGYQNVEDQVPMSTDSIFRIFSMTKPVTGTALMMLYDEGKFQLDDPLEKHIPALAGMTVFVSEDSDGNFVTEPSGHPMTIRELVSHTGGLLYTPPLSGGPVATAYSAAGINDLPNYTLSESIPALGDIPLGYQPGTQWVYSISVDVQGYLVEVLSGQTFDQFLQQRIFDPLGMIDTSFFVAPEKADRLARQYFPANGSLSRVDDGSFLEEPKFFSGGGGLTSTASDYMKFAQMHLNGGELDGVRILSEEAVQIMRSNQLPDAVKNIADLYPGNVFGVDFAIVDEPEKYNGAPRGTHWWWGIAGSWFWIDPVENIIVIGMIQNSNILYSLEVHAAIREALYQ